MTRTKEFDRIYRDKAVRQKLADLLEENPTLFFAMDAVLSVAMTTRYPAGMRAESVALAASHDAGMRCAISLLRELMSPIPDKHDSPTTEDLVSWGELEPE